MNGDIPFGILNTHFNCYWNSCLQSLYGLPVLTSLFCKDKVTKIIDKNEKSDEYNTKISAVFLKKYLKFINIVDEKKETITCILNPSSLLKPFFHLGAEISAIIPGREEDAIEALTLIIELMSRATVYDYTPRLTQDIKGAKNKTLYENYKSMQKEIEVFPYSVITPVFSGRFVVHSECTCCHHSTKRFESFSHITLHFDAEEDMGDTVRINKMLRRYFRDEKTTRDNTVDCDYCHDKTRRIISKKILKLPYILIIQLGRFVYNRDAKKVDNDVEFPIDKPFNVEKYLDKDTNEVGSTYLLTSVIQHHGTTPRGGHYTALSKRGSSWYDFNDKKIRRIENQDDKLFDSLDTTAYILMYTYSDD